MPVTAKLSRTFYEKLGDEVANELVEWFNVVDATYRADLRELNELNFARFDAKVEQRFVESDARMTRRMLELDTKMDRLVLKLDAKIDRVAAELRAEMRAGFALADARLEQRLAEFETRLTKRMFGFWIAQSATTAALVFGVVKLLGS